MSIRNILVAFNGSDSSMAAIQAGIMAHERHGAHITGLLAHQSAQSRLREESWVPDEIRNTLDHLEASEHSKIRDMFLTAAKGRVAEDRLHWIERFGNADKTVADYSLMYDVTIVGRRDSLQGKERYELHPERIAVQSGRPVLVIPTEIDPKYIYKHAVLAWDGNRGATSALYSSMSILEAKQKVSVLTIDTPKLGKPLEGIDVLTTLGRHGVNAERHIVPKHPSGVAQSILNFCEQTDAGLLVMGAFQNSVFREELFGGVTKQVINASKIPVLISH